MMTNTIAIAGIHRSRAPYRVFGEDKPGREICQARWQGENLDLWGNAATVHVGGHVVDEPRSAIVVCDCGRHWSLRVGHVNHSGRVQTIHVEPL